MLWKEQVMNYLVVHCSLLSSKICSRPIIAYSVGGWFFSGLRLMMKIWELLVLVLESCDSWFCFCFGSRSVSPAWLVFSFCHAKFGNGGMVTIVKSTVKLHLAYARNTRVQFANIRKMVLCQGLPRCLCLCVDPCMARHAQSLNSSLHAWPQNLEAFLTTRKQAKKGKMWSVLLSNIRFIWFLQSMFL